MARGLSWWPQVGDGPCLMPVILHGRVADGPAVAVGTRAADCAVSPRPAWGTRTADVAAACNACCQSEPQRLLLPLHSRHPTCTPLPQAFATRWALTSTQIPASWCSLITAAMVSDLQGESWGLRLQIACNLPLGSCCPDCAVQHF